VVDSLPVIAAASAALQPIVAVDVGGSSVVRKEIENSGFAATYMRGLEIVMQYRYADVRTLAIYSAPTQATRLEMVAEVEPWGAE
jgi:hypothetical protein